MSEVAELYEIWPLVDVQSMIAQKKWYIGYTHSNAERKAYKLITRRGIDVFLPMRKEERKWSDRVKLLNVPLFPSYIFVNAHQNVLHDLTGGYGIVNFISFGSKFAYITEQVVTSIEIMMAQKPHQIKREASQLKPGVPIIISKGPFKGFKGEIIKFGNRSKLFINIKDIRQGLSLEIEQSEVSLTSSF